MTVVFVANRAEIASRVLRTVAERGFTGAVAYPSFDADLPYVAAADITVELSGPRDFIDPVAMVDAARRAGADLVHPGYGFLSENAAFARAVEAAGMTFVGPGADIIELMGDKAGARRAAAVAGLSVPAGSDGAVTSIEDAQAVGSEAGFPVMVKAVAGGGGIGMAIVREPDELAATCTSVMERAASVFDDDRIIVERYIERSRHIEVQVMGLPDGRVFSFAERDCSVQRRHQKVVEESPSPTVSDQLRAHLRAWSKALAESVGYVGAGTVEFIHDLDTGESHFLEMNTRLQVEHPVTEAVHGVDLVAWQLDIALGDVSVPGFAVDPEGHAIELRVYAEDSRRFLPRPGRVTTWVMPAGSDNTRVEAGYAEGTTVTPFFDPLLAKIITWGPDRSAALASARAALAATRIEGPGVNLEFLGRVLDEPAFIDGIHDTRITETMGGLTQVGAAPDRT